MKNMNFRTIFVLGAVLACGMASTARAQVGVYASVIGERLSGITCLTPTGCAASNGTAQPYGGTFGAYYDFRSYGPVLFGFDVRGSVLSSNKSAYSYQASSNISRQYSALGGVRGTFRTPYKVLRPYVQFSAGLGKTDATAPPLPGTTSLYFKNFTQIQGFAGLDLALFPVMDIRIIELGEGALIGSDTHNIESIGVGLVFHTSRAK